MVLPLPPRLRRFFHVTPYHVGNSLRGARLARRLGYHAVDWDLHVTKDGIAVVTHWRRPWLDGFRGAGINRRTRIDDMTLAQVRLLAAGKGRYKIQTASRMLREAAQLGLRVELDAKDSPALEHQGVWDRLRAQSERLDVEVQVKVISRLPGAGARLKAAHNAGFPTIVLPRPRRSGGPVPRSWRPYITYARGRVRWAD